MTFNKKENKNSLRVLVMLVLTGIALCDSQNAAQFYNKGSIGIKEINSFVEGKFPYSSNLKINDLELVS
jgi:hypothetical protein